MMRWIVGLSLRSKSLVLVLAACVAIFGIDQLRSMPRDVLPEFGPPTVEVQTEALGLSAQEVEELITVPLEQDLLNGVAFLDEMRSESIPGLSSIVMVFEPGTDIMHARQVVGERMTQAHALPNVSKPPQMLEPLSATNRVMMVGLSSKNLSQIDMSVLARWNIKPRLMSVPGVANVSIWGQRERQLQVQVDPAQLAANNVTLDQIIRTAGNSLWVSPLTFLEASTPGTGGFIDTPNQRLGIQHELPIKTPFDLAQVPIERPEGQAGPPVRLGHVTKVTEDHQPLIGDAHTNDGPGLIMVIEKFPEANVVDVTHELEKTIKTMAPGLNGVKMDTSVYRPSTYIENATNNLVFAALVGFALLVLVLGGARSEWRIMTVRVATILLSLFAAALVLFATGTTLNAMIIAGIALALVVLIDDAIESTESIQRRLRLLRRVSDKSAASSALDATLDVRSPLTFTTLIILFASVPIFMLDGQIGAFLKPLAMAYIVTIFSSLVISLTAVPVLSQLLLHKSSRGLKNEPLTTPKFQERYTNGLMRAIRIPRLGLIVGLITVLTMALAVALFDHNKSPMPTFMERDLLVNWKAAPGTSLPEMNRITTKAVAELKALPGVNNAGANVGRAIMSDQVTNVSSGQLWVSIDPGADYEATLQAVQGLVDDYSGVEHTVTTYSGQKIDQTLTKVDEDLTVRIYGQDRNVLRAKAEEIKKLMAETPGITDARINTEPEEPTIEVRVDLSKAEAHGIKPGDVRRASAALLSGLEVGNLFEEQKVFEVVVWGAPNTRANLTAVRDLMIDKPAGGQVRMGDIADISIKPTPSVIWHESVFRSLDVYANVKGVNVNNAAEKLGEKIASVSFPLEHHAELLGDYKDRQSQAMRLALVIAAAVLGIYLLLQAAFRSWRFAGLVFLIVPFAMTGGIIAAILDGSLQSLGALIGLLAVLSLALRSVVMQVSYYHRMEEVEGKTFGLSLVRHGALERLGPSIMSLVACAFVLLPFIVLGSLSGFEIVHPMAVTILGGLVTSTLLNLFVIPVLYLRFGAQDLDSVVDLDNEKSNNTRRRNA